MGKSAFRKMVSGVLLLLSPGTLLAADFNAAMLYSNGPTWVNGAYVPRPSSSIFSGDLLQTRSDSVAKINEAGSMITVLSDSMVTFLGTSLDIEHGGVTISTSKGMSTTAGDVKVTPASFSWTEFNVVDVDGTVRIMARKGDLTISNGKETFTLAQGQDTTQSEQSRDNNNSNSKKKNKKQAGAAAPAAGGGILNSPVAIAVGGGVVVGITTWVLLQNGNPASPSVP
jgi:hypothetical protein